MELTKRKLGEFIERVERRNTDLQYGIDDVRGISNTKNIVQTKSTLIDRSLVRFLIVYPGEFVFNRRTDRMGGKLGIAFNDTKREFIFTEDYVAFRVRDSERNKLLPSYLSVFFHRDEFDRYVRFDSWGSAAQFFGWEEICDVSINLPPLSVQQKYVNVYNAMLANQRSYEQGLDDLRLTCDTYIEQLKHDIPSVAIGTYISAVDERNDGFKVTLAQGVNVDKVFIPAKRVAADTDSTRIVRHGQFAYNKVMKSNGTKLPIALRDGKDCFVSGSYQVFEVIKKDELLSEYLMMWLSRAETQRYAGFISWGSTRDVLQFDTLCEIAIPIPDIKVQQYIVNIYTVYQLRREINEQLKAQIKDLCPILIKGSLEEAARA